MVGLTGKHTNGADDAVGSVAQAERDSMWGPIPGEVLAYDAPSMTATVRPLYKPMVDGEPIDMPDLYEVPVDMPRTANGAITVPVPAGTRVMLSPQMRAIDEYEEGNAGTPYDARSFHVSNMRASLAGGDSLASPLPNVDPDNFHLRFNASGSFGLKGSPDGKFQLNGSQGNFLDILAEAIELIADDGLNIKSGSSSGLGIHELEHRAELIVLAGKLRAMVL